VSAEPVEYLLIGGGVASASCAERLREEGADGRIVLVGREADPPYHRPPLSKGYLSGSSGREDALLHAAGWWEEHGIELLARTSVMKLDPAVRVVKLSNREELRFEKALLATGANVRRLRAEGGDLDGIHYLRAFGNADAIRADVESAEEVVVIGGSYLGAEVAASLTAPGRRCTVLMQEDVMLDRHFGAVVGGFFQGILEEHGVRVRGGDQLERFEGPAEGRVTAVITAGGERLPCQCVVVAAGVTPDVMLARSAGLVVGESGGVSCSSRLESSVPGVYAAGDVAEWDSPLHGRSARIEHWDVAREQGRVAALNMLGRDLAYEVMPYFWSDLSEWVSLEYVGVDSPGSGGGVVRGSMGDGEFTAFYRDGEGRVTGVLTVGRSHELEPARRLIRERGAPDAAALADVSTDLAEL